MFVIIVLIYFSIILVGTIAAFSAEFRSLVISGLYGVKHLGKRAASRPGIGRFFVQFRNTTQGAYAIGSQLFNAVASHLRLSFLALLLLVLPCTLAIFASQNGKIFEFDDGDPSINPQIAMLMAGERLVPPPSLPPEAFTTSEVEQIRPNIMQASRNWSLLDAAFVQRLLMIFKLMKERHGYEMTLLEGYRSPERQAQLFARGKQVTQAAANMSYHQYGLAADSAFIRDGMVVISERDPWAMRGYQLYGELAEELGLSWGGRWTFQDYGHVELRRKGVLGAASGE